MVEKISSRYKIISRIGQGGMAEIYLAEDTFDGKRVAVKVLHPDKKNDIVAIKRFNSELKLTEKVDSPYVIKIFDHVFNAKVQYIVMEYIDGSIFKNYIERRTRLTVDETIEFSKQIALGLQEIHDQGIIHRDIKSTNIMISEHGKIKIIDFGIALTEESDRLTRADKIIASVQYLAPEILLQEKPTVKFDIYAFGILMFEMITGDLPFNGKDAITTAFMHKKSSVPQVNKIVENIPQSVANIISKATAKDKNLRYNDMIEMYNDLNTCLSKERFYEEPINLNKKNNFSIKKIIMSKWITVIMIVILLIAVILIALSLGMGWF
ncbi:MAG: serine/threonine protein kinase [Mycoplasma sp.]|nr:serine/threonine protein kinase [Mycoplasma sp.]